MQECKEIPFATATATSAEFNQKLPAGPIGNNDFSIPHSHVCYLNPKDFRFAERDGGPTSNMPQRPVTPLLTHGRQQAQATHS